jgi:crotonobetainyl-CoA:carnitine CoA-transferase CaiB-like acyl-CoA transferase
MTDPEPPGPWRVHDPTMPLAGVRVLDAGTVLAAPGTAARLGEFGADVIKIEHPSGDTTRTLGWAVDGVTLWSKWVNRNKRPITLNLSASAGHDLLLRLTATADVLIESFRPGTLERWNLSPDRLHETNPGLIVVRCSGFGQTGPYRERPGFGTTAESISGLAHMTGFPDGPPLLPPIALADEAASLLGAYAVMLALYGRDVSPSGTGGGEPPSQGRGQVIDLSLFESLFPMMGPLPAVHDLLGEVPGRIGNGIAYSSPRGAYPTSDGRWIGLSGSSQSVAVRLLELVGGRALAADPRFTTNAGRLEHRVELDRLIADWTSARTQGEALAELERHHVAAAPVLDIAGIMRDPQYAAREAIVRVPDEELGRVAMAAPRPVLSATPGHVRHAGLPKGAANEEVYGALGVSPQELAALREQGVV